MIMRKLFCTAVFLIGMTVMSTAQNLSERVYIATDKSVYVAGDQVFCSAFCFDMNSGQLSSASDIAYVELISNDGPVQTGKIALKSGRGGGSIIVPNTLPTGNYELIAYTSQSFNEEDMDYESGAKVISIFNPLTNARSTSGVEILDSYPETNDSQEVSGGGLDVERREGSIMLTNTSDKPMSVCLSVFHDDGILSPDEGNILGFKEAQNPARAFAARRALDYEGEIIRASIRGISESELATVTGKLAFLSVPGRSTDIYSSKIDQEGNATFYTNNIYGNVEAVLEIGAPDLNCHLDIMSPFANIKASRLLPLKISRSLEDRLAQRSVSMQLQNAQHADTLLDVLPINPKAFLTGEYEEYKLDDYTRFTLMEELFVEFIKDVSIRKGATGRELDVKVFDTHKTASRSQFSSLVLLDGVPVLDHERILTYDPLLVEKIKVYHHSYSLGEWYYSGIISLETYKKTLPSYSFPENARIVSFQGASLPSIANLPVKESGVPDLRQTLLWHPEIKIEAGQSINLAYVLPSYDGIFKVKVEGCDSSGKAIYVEK